MNPKYRITVEYICDEKSIVCVQDDYDLSEIKISMERFVTKRYELGKIVGYWNQGYNLEISANYKNQVPEPF